MERKTPLSPQARFQKPGSFPVKSHFFQFLAGPVVAQRNAKLG